MIGAPFSTLLFRSCVVVSFLVESPFFFFFVVFCVGRWKTDGASWSSSFAVMGNDAHICCQSIWRSVFITPAPRVECRLTAMLMRVLRGQAAAAPTTTTTINGPKPLVKERRTREKERERERNIYNGKQSSRAPRGAPLSVCSYDRFPANYLLLLLLLLMSIHPDVSSVLHNTHTHTRFTPFARSFALSLDVLLAATTGLSSVAAFSLTRAHRFFFII